MNFRYTFLSCVLVFFYSCKKNNDFFENYQCDKISIENGITITDYSERYQVTFPDSSWLPEVNILEFPYGISGGVFDENSYKFFSVIELSGVDLWKSKEEQQSEIESQFNVIESGRLNQLGKEESLWNLVVENDSTPLYTFFVTIEHPNKNLFYTLNLSVTRDRYGLEDICELENLVNSFKILD